MLGLSTLTRGEGTEKQVEYWRGFTTVARDFSPRVGFQWRLLHCTTPPPPPPMCSGMHQHLCTTPHVQWHAPASVYNPSCTMACTSICVQPLMYSGMHQHLCTTPHVQWHAPASVYMLTIPTLGSTSDAETHENPACTVKNGWCCSWGCRPLQLPTGD